MRPPCPCSTPPAAPRATVTSGRSAVIARILMRCTATPTRAATTDRRHFSAPTRDTSRPTPTPRMRPSSITPTPDSPHTPHGRITAVGCWAHARRNFFDARINQPREAHYVLGLIAQLYEVEDRIQACGPEQRVAARQEHSVPVLTRLETYLRAQQPGALPKSQYGQAIGYALKHCDALSWYTSDGYLEIDNNATERTIRPCAISRKNGCFSAAIAAAQPRRSCSASWPARSAT